ncbi:MAG: hypothetical protein IJ480_12420 [Clostridia bacterium]|nr:hypothetical protein [Clostridia bacterium]
MKKFQILAAVLLAGTMFLTGCGGSETENDTDTETAAETTLEETTQTEETEEETEKETETKKQQETFTDYQKLTISEEEAPYYDAATGTFVVRFTEDKVRYLADDACGIGISGDGEAYSVAGTIDMESHPEFANGDYYTGIAVKPSDTIYEGKYNVTITFAMYMVTFPCTVG